MVLLLILTTCRLLLFACLTLVHCQVNNPEVILYFRKGAFQIKSSWKCTICGPCFVHLYFVQMYCCCWSFCNSKGWDEFCKCKDLFLPTFEFLLSANNKEPGWFFLFKWVCRNFLERFWLQDNGDKYWVTNYYEIMKLAFNIMVIENSEVIELVRVWYFLSKHGLGTESGQDPVAPFWLKYVCIRTLNRDEQTKHKALCF